MQSNLFNHGVWYSQVSKDSGVIPLLVHLSQAGNYVFAGKEGGFSGLCRVEPQAGPAQPWIPAALSSKRCKELRLQPWEPGVMLQVCRRHDQAVPAAFAALVWGSVAVCRGSGRRPSEATRRFCARNESFRGNGERNARPRRSGPSILLGGRGAVLPDQLIPTHCGRSFPGTQKPALVCDQIPGITKPGCSTLLPSRCIAVRTPSRITFLCQPPLSALSFLLVGFAVLTALFRGWQRSRAGEEDPGPLNRLACGSHGSGPAVPFSSCPHSQELFAELRAPVQNCFSKEPLSA